MTHDADRMQLISMVDQDLAEWRDCILDGTADAGLDRSIAYWLDRLPAAWSTDTRELVAVNLIDPLLHIGLLTAARWTAERDPDRVDAE